MGDRRGGVGRVGRVAKERPKAPGIFLPLRKPNPVAVTREAVL